jgi:PAS domain S-box-containing protein
MNKQKTIRGGTNFALVVSILSLLGLNIVSFKNQLLFHFLIETIAIVLCACLFTIVWILRERIDNGFYNVLGIGMLFSAFFDLMHILTFEGMPIFPNLGLNESFYFFLAGRLLQGLTFLVAPICVGKTTRNNLALLLYSLISLAMTLVIIQNDLPPLFSPSGSHTLMRSAIDSIIIVLFCVALYFIYRRREDFERRTYLFILGAIFLTMLSEITISLNTNEAHLISVVGLNVRLIAYYMIFQTIFVTGITKPQEVFYHSLATSREQLQSLFNNLNEGICIVDQNEDFIFGNPAAAQILMGRDGKLIGQNLADFITADQHKKLLREFDASIQFSRNSFEMEIIDGKKRTRALMVFSSPRIIDGKIEGRFIVFHDITERKANQAKLEDASRIYQTLFMDAPIRIWENDYSKVKAALNALRENGVSDIREYFTRNPDQVRKLVSAIKIKNYNKLVERTYARGNPPQKITSFSEIFWERSYDFYINELIAIANNQRSATYEMTTQAPDGRIIYSIINLSLVSSENLDYSRVIISADDITERETSRLELQSSEQKFRLLAENSGVGISYFDLQGKVLYQNDKFLEHFGKASQNYIGKQIDILFDKETSKRFLKRIQRTAESVESINFIDSIFLPAGRKWYSLTFTRIMEDEEHCIGVQIISHDITQRKEMEEQLESLARFPRENPNPVMRLNKSGVVTYSNEGGYPILKVWNYEEKGQIPDHIKIIIQNCLNYGKPEIIEEKVNDRIVSLYLAPVVDMDYVNIYGRDITDLKEAEEKLFKYSRDLEKAVEEKTSELLQTQDRLARQEKLAVMGQLASGVGHELRNPLAVINNAVYMLRLGPSEQTEEPPNDYLDIIDQEVASANKIITDLLTFARIKPASLNPTDLHATLADVLKKFVPPDNVKVNVELPMDLPNVIIDEKQIEQVMANLVTNAYQAIPNNGKLTISGKAEQRMVRLDFIDTGIGIPHENLEKIFEPLFSTKTKGIGLGLTISRMLAEANGGKIKVSSTLRKGSTFSLYLPREKNVK